MTDERFLAVFNIIIVIISAIVLVRDIIVVITETCEGESMCCEDPEVHDCVFSYSPSHLEALHRNCSGGRECEVKTERTQEESVACPFFNPQDTVSHTILDYVCIEDKAMLDICTPSETTVLGRTLFAMLDSRTWRSPLGGAVCRCTAESSQWPTTNTISVFVVDIRLNVLRQAQCSKADLVLRSGSTTRHLDCATSRDPRLAYPFVALLNHSNVATIELFLHSKLPEYIWIGFESNEPEDIRLSCGLQGYIPLDIDDAATRGNGSAGGFYGQSSGVLPAGAISGILVAVMVVLAVAIVLIVLFVKIRSFTIKGLEPPPGSLD
nr:hypothetical protein BaRGS_008267 [Batillaria attramentaria]